MRKGIFNLLSMSILFFANQGYAQQINSHLQAKSTLQNHVSSILKENIKKIDAIYWCPIKLLVHSYLLIQNNKKRADCFAHSALLISFVVAKIKQ